MTYNLDFGRVSNVIPAHDDAVSTLKILAPLGLLISGSWDCSVKYVFHLLINAFSEYLIFPSTNRIWKGFDASDCTPFRMSDAIVAYLSLEEKVSSVDVMNNENIIQVAVGTFSGDVLLWKLCSDNLSKPATDLESLDTKVLTKHLDEVTSVQFNESKTKIASASLDGTFHICDIKTGMVVLSQQHNNPIICLDWKYAEEYLTMGDENGNLIVWNMITGTEHTQSKAFVGLVSCLVTCTSEKKIITAGIDRKESVGTETNEFSLKVFDCL